MGIAPGPKVFSAPRFPISSTPAATAPTGTAAEATTTVPNPFRNERRLISARPGSLWDASLMRWMIGRGANERGRLEDGRGGCIWAETTFEDVVLAVINP